MPELMYDQFMISKKIQLNNDDIDSLTKLYLPLMGLDSYALYYALSTMDEHTPYNYKMLLDTLMLKSLNALNKASSKLEALGLLKVYKNKDNNYLYDLLRPMEVSAFLKEEALCALLKGSIGEDEVNKLKDKYLKTYSSYKDISKKFEDVFEINTSNDLSFIKMLTKRMSGEVEIENKNFNYALFKMLFDTSFISESALENPDFKSNILRLSHVYKLDEEKMHDVVLSALSIDKDLNYASLAKYSKLEYRNNNETAEPVLSTKEDDDYLTSIKDDAALALCTRLEAMSPSEVLEWYSGGKKASLAEIAMFDKVSKNTGTSIPLINLMIVYSVVTKEGEIPGQSYFEKIAATWKRAKIKTVYDGIKYMQAKAIEKESKVKGGTKKEVKLPSWYKNYKEELNKKDSENKELQESDVLDIIEAAKGLFGDDDE